MRNIIEAILGGAGSILFAAAVLGIFRAAISLRENTKAVRELGSSFEAWRSQQNAAHDSLVERMRLIEDWRTHLDSMLLQRNLGP